MAAWYEPAGGASRATCVAQIVTDINSYVTTSTDGLTTFDIDGFMALAATRLAAIPDPTATGEYYVMAGVLRSTNVRPDVEVLLGSLENVQADNAGYDLQPHTLELQRLSDAVTAYYNRLYNDLLPDLLDNYLAAGSLELGLPAVDDTTTETRFYRTTFVTDWGEESAPSDVSVSVEVGSKDTVTIGRGTVPSGRNISYWRVYRSAHGSETSAWLYTPNSASDQGVAVATTTFTDDVPNSELQEVCPSLIWSEPPTNLRGLVGMANGINVGFFDNVLCSTPAYVPYAFPEEYRVTVEWPIVGLGAWEQSVFVGTTGHPYFLTGADAANLTARKLNSNQACVSPRSICPVEEGVIYASPDGLCLATSGGVRLITSQHFTREEWQDQDLDNLVVRQHDGVVYWVPGVVPGSGNYRWADANSFQGVSFTNDARTFNMNVATTGAAAIRNGRTGVALSGKVYCEFILTARAGSMAVAMGITYEQLTGDLSGVNYSSIRAGLLEFRRRCEAIQHGVIVHQMCRPIWRAWMDAAVLSGALAAPGYAKSRQAARAWQAAKWIPQGWQWVDPEKEFKALQLAIRSGLMSRSEAISSFGYDAETIDKEIAADNARADALGLVLDTDPRQVARNGATNSAAPSLPPDSPSAPLVDQQT